MISLLITLPEKLIATYRLILSLAVVNRYRNEPHFFRLVPNDSIIHQGVVAKGDETAPTNILTNIAAPLSLDQPQLISAPARPPIMEPALSTPGKKFGLFC